MDATIQATVGTDYIHFGVATNRSADVDDRAEWANNLQELAEGQGNGVPFVLSSEAENMVGNGRHLARRFSEEPAHLKSPSPCVVEEPGRS